MPIYEVLRDCATGETGQLVEGSTVDLDPEVADRLNAVFDPPAVKAVKRSTRKSKP